MTMTATLELTALEQELLALVRTLPPNWLAQVMDFAQFLAFQTQTVHTGNGWDEAALAQEDPTGSSEERWDHLLAQPEAKKLMRQLAQEALEEHRTGQTLEITLTDDGRIAPA
jgi:hypothetical protein